MKSRYVDLPKAALFVLADDELHCGFGVLNSLCHGYFRLASMGFTTLTISENHIKATIVPHEPSWHRWWNTALPVRYEPQLILPKRHIIDRE